MNDRTARLIEAIPQIVTDHKIESSARSVIKNVSESYLTIGQLEGTRHIRRSDFWKYRDMSADSNLDQDRDQSGE